MLQQTEIKITDGDFIGMSKVFRFSGMLLWFFHFLNVFLGLDKTWTFSIITMIKPWFYHLSLWTWRTQRKGEGPSSFPEKIQVIISSTVFFCMLIFPLVGLWVGVLVVASFLLKIQYLQTVLWCAQSFCWHPGPQYLKKLIISLFPDIHVSKVFNRS